jgi:fructokinase
MSEKQFKIVGLGEILWDLLPSGKKMLGGTTANFAYIAEQLGNNGIIVSRIGNDEIGLEVPRWLKPKGIVTDYIQTDQKYPTGTVIVSFENGQPIYEVVKPVAWDFLEMNDNLQDLALSCDAVCFGTLGQRAEVSRETIQKFIKLTKSNCLRVFDVNLRQEYYSKEVLSESLNLVDVVKLNHEELPIVAELSEIKGDSVIETAKNLRQKFNLKLLCVTRGSNGSLLITENGFDENSGVKIKVADTIGAGDAFTAALTHGFLRGWNLDKINEFANKVGAFVASQTGAMPDFPKSF